MPSSVFRPMLLLACALTTGSASRALFAFTSPFASIVVALIAAMLFLFISFLLRRRLHFIMALLIAIAFIVGAASADRAMERAQRVSVSLDTKAALACRARVIRFPQIKSWGTRVDVQLDSCSEGKGDRFEPAFGAVRLSILHGGDVLLPGDHIQFRARFTRPRDYRNPGAFSYARYLAVHGIGATGRVVGKPELVQEGAGFGRIVGGLRRRVRDSLAQVADPARRGVLLALAIGARDDITAEQRDRYARAGLAHLLAISGLHVGYVALLVFLLARVFFGLFPRLFLRVPLQRLAAAVTLPAIWGFVALAAFPISAVRAAIMISVFLLGVLIGRRQDLPTTLAAAVCVILIILPLSVFDVSFQLSVVAVAGIMLLVPRIARALPAGRMRTGRALRAAALLGAVTVAATLATLPLVAAHFQVVTFAGLVTNLVAVPLAGIALVPLVAVAQVVALIAPAIAAPIWSLAAVLAGALDAIASAGARWGDALVFRWAPSPLEAGGVLLLIAAVVFWPHRTYKRWIGTVLVLVCLAGVGFAGVHMMEKPSLEMVVLDVGQGDAILVRFPDGSDWLIDGGGKRYGSFDVGEKVVVPALLRLGVHHLHGVVLTHPHHDHYRGLGAIARAFQPPRILTNGLDAPPQEKGHWARFQAQLAELSVPLEVVPEGKTTYAFGGAQMHVIRLPWQAGDDLNDSSLVVDLRFGAHRFLLMGDLAETGEGRLLAIEGDLYADVLKVGHHGSIDATTPELLSAVDPKVAIISVGENPYGVPHAATLERLGEAEIDVLRTDEDGAVAVESDGERLFVKSLTP